MARLAEGDRQAFRAVYAVLWPLLCAFAGRRLQSDEAEDVAQETLVKLFSGAAEFDATRDASAWALGIAAFEVRTSLGRRMRRREDAEGEYENKEASDVTPEEALIARDLEAAAMEILGTLSPADVETLTAALNGRRPAVAGATFRKRMQRALERIRAAWRSRHGNDE